MKLFDSRASSRTKNRWAAIEAKVLSAFDQSLNKTAGPRIRHNTRIRCILHLLPFTSSAADLNNLTSAHIDKTYEVLEAFDKALRSADPAIRDVVREQATLILVAREMHSEVYPIRQ